MTFGELLSTSYPVTATILNVHPKQTGIIHGSTLYNSAEHPDPVSIIVGAIHHVGEEGSDDGRNVKYLANVKDFIKNNNEIFSGIGKFKEKLKIEIKEGVCPVVRPPRRVPLTIHKTLEKKLEELEKQGVIERTEPSSWGSGFAKGGMLVEGGLNFFYYGDVKKISCGMPARVWL
ncbi:hypothetical protein QE152_g38870 [Popillia japonica]|uniref:Uncharacterized protein n=1 Tax=Popillia japonica TaxID=7064 RepID=A0AAW1HVQ1_POPJA